MRFWKKLFGAKESTKADIACGKSTQPSAASNPRPPVSLRKPRALLDAVYKGDLEKVKALLKDNRDLVLSKDDSGMPLHHAAFSVNEHFCLKEGFTVHVSLRR